MKKEWIMSEEQRIQKRKRIEENRQKRRALGDKGGEQSGGEAQTDEVTKTEDPTPCAKSSRSDQQQQNLTNAGFSPGMILIFSSGVDFR